MKNEKSKFFSLRKVLKNEILDYLTLDENSIHYCFLDKQIAEIIITKITTRQELAKICVKMIKSYHNFNNLEWNESIYDVFVEDELYFYKDSELLNSWSEPLVMIFSDCFQVKPNIENLRVNAENFLRLFRHYEKLWFNMIKKFWMKKNQIDNFFSLFYFKKPISLVEYFNNKNFLLDDF